MARRKGIARRSKKRLAYLASEDRKQGVEHMGKVAQLPCLVCGRYGVEVHHEGKPRSDMHVLPAASSPRIRAASLSLFGPPIL